MRFDRFSFGSICIDGVTYEHEVVIERGEVRKRKKRPSKKYRDAFGHSPLSVDEDIPWRCRRLVIGTGEGALPEEIQEGRPLDLELLDAGRAGEHRVSGGLNGGKVGPEEGALLPSCRLDQLGKLILLGEQCPQDGLANLGAPGSHQR